MEDVKKSFLLYIDQKNNIDKMTNEQVGELFKAVYHYAAEGELPAFHDLITDIMFETIRTALDRDTAKWNDIKKKRSEAGKKGNEKRWGKSYRKNRKNRICDNTNECGNNGTEELQPENRKIANIAVNGNDMVKVNDIGIVMGNSTLNKSVVVSSLNTDDWEGTNNNDNNVFEFNFLKTCQKWLYGEPQAIANMLTPYADMDRELILRALGKTSALEKPSWRYTLKVLEDWKSKGVMTLADQDEERRQYEASKQGIQLNKEVSADYYTMQVAKDAEREQARAAEEIYKASRVPGAPQLPEVIQERNHKGYAVQPVIFWQYFENRGWQYDGEDITDMWQDVYRMWDEGTLDVETIDDDQGG